MNETYVTIVEIYDSDDEILLKGTEKTTINIKDKNEKERKEILRGILCEAKKYYRELYGDTYKMNLSIMKEKDYIKHEKL